MRKTTVSTVEEYIQQHEGEVKERLQNLRALVQEYAPDAVEGFAYHMPAYKLGVPGSKKPAKPLVYFAAFAGHIGFYPTPSGIADFAEELAGYASGKGSVQFPHSQPLPTALIARILQHQVGKLQAQSA